MGSPADPVATLRAALDALERATTRGHHGRWSAQRRSNLFDGCLEELWGELAPPPAFALAALGGYGRRVQLPRSDLDLLVVHAGADPDEVRRVAEGISYPLWDAGFELGLVVRTPQECAEAAAERLDSLTAMLDARLLAGPEELLQDATVPVRRIAAVDVPGFARRLRAAAVARRERFGSTAHLLEPDLKEGGGGLRDVASLGWLRAAAGSPLEDAGLLRTREGAAVDAAEGFLLRVRSAVHLETGRRADRLVMELQPAVAAEMGFVDEPGLPAADGLMRAVFEHARNVELVHDLALDRVLDEGDAPTVPNLAGPAQVLRALGELAEAGAVPSSALLDAVEAADVPDPVVWTPEVRDAFVGLLRDGPAGARMLDVLDRIGLLVRFLPAWDAVRCRPQRDPYHRFTVDAHLLAAASGVAELLAGPADADDPLQAEAAGTIERPDGVLLGALLHDIGKVGQGNHAAIGAGIAERQLRTMALETADRDLAAFIVAEHLVLPDTATRRDLTDENLVLDVAARVGTPERLAALYLLAKADARATGPAAWTPWRQALIRELVGKVQRAFERGEMGAELAATLAERVDRLRELLAAEPDDLVDRFVLRMPRGYFLAVGPDRAARHLSVVMPDLGTHEVRTASHATGAAGTHELLVVANDRPGLLSWIAGSLALGGISILSAQAFTTEDGVAVDLFEVEGAFEPEIDERRWRAFRSSLRRAIDGSASLERRVEEQRGAYPAHRAPAPVTVTVDNEASEFSTVLEVGAPDRIGLLFDITRTFADLRLDVHLAKVTTFEGRVVDAFYLRDALGRKVTDPKQLAEVHEALRERLG